MAQSKATKKFEKKHLGRTLKNRGEAKKIKQRDQTKLKKKIRKAKDNENAITAGEEKAKQTNVDTKALNAISVDDFFAGGIDIAKDSRKSTSSATKSSKRKRTPVDDEEEAEGSSSDGIDANLDAVASDSDPEGGAASENDADAHKQQLAELSKKDPEFFKYLQQEEPELLDFDEDADLAALDALSADEDEVTPRKRRKTGDDRSDDGDDHDVTQSMVKKWSTAMSDKHSLRASKEVVLAFRSAVHGTEDETKKYKYTVSDPDG